MAKQRTDREGDVLSQALITDAEGNPVWVGSGLQEPEAELDGFDEEDDEEVSLEDFRRAFADPDNIEIRDLGTAG